MHYVQDQFGNYVAQRMIECSEVDVLQVIHSKMLHVIHDVTPSVDDKMRKNLEVNLQKPNIVELAKVYCQNIEAFEYVRHKHADILPKVRIRNNFIDVITKFFSFLGFKF